MAAGLRFYTAVEQNIAGISFFKGPVNTKDYRYR